MMLLRLRLVKLLYSIADVLLSRIENRLVYSAVYETEKRNNYSIQQEQMKVVHTQVVFNRALIGNMRKLITLHKERQGD